MGKPNYVHIVATGESWLFLAGGEAEKVWLEAQRAGYELVAGGIAGDARPVEVSGYLGRALCQEDEPLNTRRKITHSRELFKKTCPTSKGNESKGKGDCAQEDGNMNAVPNKEPVTWNSEVIMKPIEQIARELEAEGWHILWKSKVEAIAVKKEALGASDMDIVELMESLGVKLRRVGKEYMGLCPFHDDCNPSLSVNRERGLWRCFGCGRSGDVHKFVAEWQARLK